MAHERYNHSYTHCQGENCDLKDTCVHHLALQEAADLKLEHVKVVDNCNDKELNYVRVRIEKD